MLTVHPTLLIGPADWQPERMPKDEFLRRIASLLSRRPGAKHALVYGDQRHHAELAYLTNFVPKLEAGLALLSLEDVPRLFVGGGTNMLDAARPLTWIKDLALLRQIEHLRLADCVLVGSGYMSAALRQNVAGAVGEAAPDVTSDLWPLMRRKSRTELDAIRAACATLAAATTAMAHAKRSGLGVTDVVLAGEKIAGERGAQDVRTLFSVDGGRTLAPFFTATQATVDPIAVYLAVRRFNYWAEGFSMLTGSPTLVGIKAAALLHNTLATIRPGTSADEVARTIVFEPYRKHPVTEDALANSIGLALEERPYTDLGATFEAGDVYSLRIGITDGEEQHALVSAMIALHEQGAEVLWPTSGAPEPRP